MRPPAHRSQPHAEHQTTEVPCADSEQPLMICPLEGEAAAPVDANDRSAMVGQRALEAQVAATVGRQGVADHGAGRQPAWWRVRQTHGGERMACGRRV